LPKWAIVSGEKALQCLLGCVVRLKHDVFDDRRHGGAFVLAREEVFRETRIPKLSDSPATLERIALSTRWT
jgi:hypothetical protein